MPTSRRVAWLSKRFRRRAHLEPRREVWRLADRGPLPGRAFAMITIDPETAEPSGAILRQVSRAHEGKAGVYAAVLAEGMVQRGDEVELLR